MIVTVIIFHYDYWFSTLSEWLHSGSGLLQCISPPRRDGGLSEKSDIILEDVVGEG